MFTTNLIIYGCFACGVDLFSFPHKRLSQLKVKLPAMSRLSQIDVLNPMSDIMSLKLINHKNKNNTNRYRVMRMSTCS